MLYFVCPEELAGMGGHAVKREPDSSGLPTASDGRRK